MLLETTLLKTHTRKNARKAHLPRGSRHATRSPRYATEHRPTLPASGIRHQASVAEEERGAIALQLARLGRVARTPRRRRVPLAP